MASPVVLTDAEAAVVGGGTTLQTMSIAAVQQTSSSFSATALATNNSRIAATAARFAVRAATVGAGPGSFAVLFSVNVLEAVTALGFAHSD